MAVTGENYSGYFLQNPYPQNTIQCYANGSLLWNADVSAYQSQAVVAPLFLWIILLGVGFLTGVFFRFILTGGVSRPMPVEGIEEEKQQ